MKGILFVIPQYIGGGAEKVTDFVASTLSASGEYETWLAYRTATPEALQNAQKAGYHTLQIPDYGRFDCEATTRWVADRMLLHGIGILVMVAHPLHDIDYIRRTVPDARIIFHFHGAPLWEVAERIEGGRAAAIASGSRSRYWKWYLLKYSKERLLHVYSRRFSRRYQTIYRSVDKFVTLCDGYRSTVRKIAKADKNDTKIRVMYNPLDTEALAPAASTPKQQEVLYVGRLSYSDKRVDRLLRIWSHVEPKHPDWTLKIVGDGPDRHNLEELAKSLGLRNVRFTGYCNDPRQHYSTASILCLTSSTEGWGLVLVEAQASGVVPVAFAVSDGVKEILGNNEFGIAVKPFDEKAYTRQLDALMSDPERRKAISLRAIDRCQRYSQTTVGQQWLQLLDNL
ncbi:MAG: glycosyltransferase [Muribaculaceae bacterium]|nr:glycosyltransferase [Muribaculaceae bacterium]